MNWLFQPMRKSDVERDVTQRTHFDTDDARIEATLVRESHQNSLDARVEHPTGPVQTRISIVNPAGNDGYFKDLFSELVPHLHASGIDLSDIDFGNPSFVLIEDFGTTGLIGRWDDWDAMPFNDFWRREGRSHKAGAANGRWGLGKLVFSAASRIRTFFGLTVRFDDKNQPLMMGEAVLSTHTLNGKKFEPYGFYALPGEEDFQLPETNLEPIKAFTTACGITRTSEPGFSVAIPFPIQQLQSKSLVEGVVRNYFFPILTGQLAVQIQDVTIDSKTFEEVAASCGKEILSPELIDFIRKIEECRQKAPDVILSPGWEKNIDSAMSTDILAKLRTAYGSRDFIHARAPITVRRKDNTALPTHFDLFLRKTPEGVAGDSLFIRSAITIPNESRYFNASDAFGALQASDEAIAEFLGDAENPAHTVWNASAEKLREKWKNGTARLSEIRSSLRNLYKTLAQLQEQTEPDALIDFFSIEDLKDQEKKPRKKGGTKPPGPLPPPTPKAYRIAAKKGGFAVKPAAPLGDESLPLIVKVRVAYDVLNGNPLKKYDPLDFKLEDPPITIASHGATCTSVLANLLEIQIEEPEFSIDVTGFDPNRDLFIDAQKERK